MKTNLTIIALSFAVAATASSGMAQQSGLAGASGAYFQEVSIEPEDDAGLAPGDYIRPASTIASSGSSGCYDGSCYSGCSTGCDTGCSSCGCNTCCCANPFAHRNGLFAEYMWLRPRDNEIAFAVPGTFAVLGPGGTPAFPVPQGATLSLNPDHQPAYRIGGNFRISDEMSMRLTYTDFESDTSNSGALDPALIGVGNSTLFPLLLHPSTQLPNNVTNIEAAGRFDIDYEAVDLDTRILMWSTCNMALNALAGTRWTQLDQDMLVGYTVNGGTLVQGNARYHGIGARFGLDGEYRSESGLGVYGSGVMSLMFGNAVCRVNQTSVIAGPQMFTNDEFARLSPIMEFEFGGQWVSREGGLKLKLGYMSSQWFNIVTVRDYVNGINSNQFDDFSDTITFDGYTATAEVAF